MYQNLDYSVRAVTSADRAKMREQEAQWAISTAAYLIIVDDILTPEQKKAALDKLLRPS